MTAAATFYILLGLVAGLLMKRFLNPPRRFRYGIIAASIWANWGDLPLAIILSVGDMPPFQTGDTKLGLAFVSTLICIFNVTLFPMGGHRIVERDFTQATGGGLDRASRTSSMLARANNEAAADNTSQKAEDNASPHFAINLLLSPTNIGIFLGILVAFIPPLKHLFVRSTAPSATEPPLYFVLDTVSFIGAAS
ncbi:hypothetical protein SYNPS1DRAFT_26087, partial [Syncephalis pseudoplumigaleata]